MLRAAVAGDEPAIEAFLARHAETSMFLRANLAHFGLADRKTPQGTVFWLAGDRDVAAVFGLSNAGFVTIRAPDAPAALFAAFRAAIAGRAVQGLAGVPEEVAAMKRALGIARVAYGLDGAQPLYRLRLQRLRVPPGPGAIRLPRSTDRALIFDWTRAYAAELHMSAPDRLDAEAHERTERALTGGDMRILEIGGAPVAMTALNARLPDMVQIGGVCTPPEGRGCGHARRAVALHMAELRTEGIGTAILFAAGPAASRAYEAIGFERIGAYTLAILKDPVTIGGAS